MATETNALDSGVARSFELMRSKSGGLSPSPKGSSGVDKRPPSLQLDELRTSSSISMSREASQSIKAGHLDSVLSTRHSKQSEDITLREQNQMTVFSSTDKYGHSPRRLTPRSSRRDGSSTSGVTVTARNSPNKASTTPRRQTTPIRELDRMAIEAKAPPRFICPISGRVMRDPVILTTGTTCDRCALERRLAKGNKRCPVSNKNLRVPISMTPNTELRTAISVWARKNAPWMMDPTGMFLLSDEPSRYEIQGDDKQYVSTPVAGGQVTPSRIDSGKGTWTFTNGSKARPGQQINMSATPGTLEAGNAPWYASRGIASPRSSRKTSRTRSSRGGSSPRKTKRNLAQYEWYSIGFFTVMSLVYVAMFILSLSFSDWTLAPMSENPWYGAPSDALVKAGALALPLMNSPGNEWWRLFSSIFLPAGVIQMAVCLIFLWVFGFYARTALPFPQASVAGLFLLSSVVGSLVSANLNGVYVSCGTFSGIISLLAVIMVNQAISWPHRKLLNLKEWYLIVLLLTVTLGGFVAISLFPMVDVWFTIGGFVSGLCLAAIIIMLPDVRSTAFEKRRLWISIQATSGVILLGIIIAAAVGCALPTKLGQSIDALQSASCVEYSSSMNCIPYGYLENGCGLTWSNETVMVACPVVDPQSTEDYNYYVASNVTFSEIGDAEVVEVQCQKYCDVRTDPINVISVPPVASVDQSDTTNSTDATVAIAPSPDDTVNVPVVESSPVATPPEVKTPVVQTGAAPVQAAVSVPPVQAQPRPVVIAKPPNPVAEQVVAFGAQPTVAVTTPQAPTTTPQAPSPSGSPEDLVTLGVVQ